MSKVPDRVPSVPTVTAEKPLVAPRATAPTVAETFIFAF